MKTTFVTVKLLDYRRPELLKYVFLVMLFPSWYIACPKRKIFELFSYCGLLTAWLFWLAIF